MVHAWAGQRPDPGAGHDGMKCLSSIRSNPSKREIRREALARRDALPAGERAAAAATIAARPLPVAVRPGAIVSGFSPLKSEINPLPLMRRFAEAGAQLALPVVVGRGQPLIMRAWSFGEPLVSGVWGIREPRPDAPEVFPDILIVPLLAFDRPGHRIGYGAGYYDMTIARLRDHEAGARPSASPSRRRKSPQVPAHRARRPPRSRANGARDDRFPESLDACAFSSSATSSAAAAARS